MIARCALLFLLGLSACAPRGFVRQYEVAWIPKDMVPMERGQVWVLADSGFTLPNLRETALLQIDRSGQMTTLYQQGGPGNQTAVGLTQDPGGNVWLFGNDRQPWAMSLDENGRLQDSLSLGANRFSGIRDLLPLDSGRLAVSATRGERPGKVALWLGGMDTGKEKIAEDGIYGMQWPLRLLRSEDRIYMLDQGIREQAGCLLRSYDLASGEYSFQMLSEGAGQVPADAIAKGEEMWFAGNGPKSDGRKTVWIIRTDAQGNHKMSAAQANNEQIESICLHRDGNLLSLGQRYEEDGLTLILRKWDRETGHEIWVRDFRPLHESYAVKVLTDPRKGYLLLGYGLHEAGDTPAMFLIRTDEEGRL